MNGLCRLATARRTLGGSLHYRQRTPLAHALVAARVKYVRVHRIHAHHTLPRLLSRAARSTV